MTTDTRDALLPCPFCGGVVEMHHPKGGAYNDITYLLCDSCGAVCSFRPNLKGSKAMAAWNCRTPRPEDARDAVRYRKLLAHDLVDEKALEDLIGRPFTDMGDMVDALTQPEAK